MVAHDFDLFFSSIRSSFQLNDLILFSVLLLSGVVLAQVTARFRVPIPRISSFMLAGFLIGPEVLHILTPELLEKCKNFVDIALALILFRLGQQVDFDVFRRRPSLVLTALLEAVVTFFMVFFSFCFIGYSQLHAAVIATVAISASPAVLISLVNELGLKGRITAISMDLVAANNVTSSLVFSLILPFLHYQQKANWSFVLFQPLYTFFCPVFLGYMLAHAVLYLSDFISRKPLDQYSLMICSVIFGLGLSKALNMSMIVFLLSMGIFIKNIGSSEVYESVVEARYGKVGDIFLIILFVVAGAKVSLDNVFHSFLEIFVFVFMRFIGKFFVFLCFHRYNNLTIRESFYLSLIMSPMAGLAIGLMYTTQGLYPNFSLPLVPIILGSVAVLEGIGPILTEMSFARLGEIPEGEDLDH